MTFAEKLKELRAAASVSQTELARLSGCSVGAIRDYEQEKRQPSLKAASRMAKALGTTCEAFADCEDMSPEPKKPTRRKKKGGAF
jgi:transcriptional regulator with XRE-family HTH domain